MSSKGTSQPGEVVLVGVGPGDPAMITTQVYAICAGADVLIHDRLAIPAAEHLLSGGGQERIDVGKAPGGKGWAQDAINALLIEKAREGKRVVRVKGGDPFVFSRGAEEFEACQAAGIPCRVVPGLSTATAAATLAGIPLTLRGVASSFHVTTGHLGENPGDEVTRWRDMAKWEGTLVVLMGVSVIGRICEGLIAGGRAPETPCAFIENASLPSERVTVSTLRAMEAEAKRVGVTSPAVLIVGEVVAHRICPAQPLRGVRVVMTAGDVRFSRSAHRMVESLEGGGAQVDHLSAQLFSHSEVSDPAARAEIVRQIAASDVALVTSPRAASALLNLTDDVRDFGACQFLVYGQASAEHLPQIRCEIIREGRACEGIRHRTTSLRGRRVIWLRGDHFTEATHSALREFAGDLIERVVYTRRESEENRGNLHAFCRRHPGCVVVWGSTEGVRFGMGDLRKVERSAVFGEAIHAAIGQPTAEALEALGQTVHIMPEGPSYERIADAIRDHFLRQRGSAE